ncbi:MAG: type IX secretion system membrane protein PorP/SprF, partial [Duncaniella sp.]|nr:type IX secretion system membrane protein PorP/SprF [Duncaniella sp.]
MRIVKSVLLRICRECRIAVTLVVSVMALIAVPDVSGQGDAMLTHYWAVPTYYNPAAAGDTDYLRLRGGSRLQWVGIDNAPRTFLATADLPFVLAGKRFGAGLVAQQESMGLYRNLTVSLQLGYKLRLLKGELTLALQGGFLNEQFKGSEVYIP